MTSPGGKEVGRISIRVVPDTSGFRAALARQLAEIEKSLKATIQADVELDTLKARGDMAVLMGRLKAQARDGVTINTKVDQSVLGKLFSGVGGGASGAAGGLGGMSRGLGIVAAVAALAAPALALISGVLVSLPAVISAVLIPIAAIALGLDGIKEAAKVLKPGFDALKKTMSAKFQDVFTPIFTKLNDIFPALESTMPGVATALGAVAKSFVDVITSGPGLDKIKGTIQNISDTITASAPGIGKLTGGLLGLAQGVSAKFPGVGKYIDDVGKSFSDWVAKVNTVDASGTSPLDRAMGNLGDTLKGVLGIIGDLAKAGFDFLQDPKFGAAMTDFVKSCQTLINDVLPGLKQFFMDLAGALKTVTDGVSAIKGLPEWAKPNSQVDRGNPKNKDGTAKDTSNIAEPFTSPDAPWRGQLEGLKKFGADLKVEFVILWATFKLKAAEAFNGVVAFFSSIPGQLSAAWSTLVGIASVIWNGVKIIVQNKLNEIGAFFTGIPGKLATAWSTITGVAQVIWNAVKIIVENKLGEMKDAVATKAGEIVAEIGSWPGKFVGALGDLGGLFLQKGRELVGGLINGIRERVGEALGLIASLSGGLAKGAGKVLKINSPSKVFYDIGTNVVDGLQNGLEGGFPGVIARASELAKQMADAINNGMTGIDAAGFQDKLKQQMAEIGLQSDELKVQLNGTADKGQKDAIRDQRTQLQNVRDQLKLQSSQLGYSEKYGQALGAEDQAISDQLKQRMAEIGLERDRLKVQLNGTTDKGQKDSIRSQMKALDATRDQLKLQESQLGYSDKYGNSLDANSNIMGETLNKMIEAGKGFADANVKQFLGDIGIQGGGALTTLADQGVGFGMQMLSKMISGGAGGTNIHVNSIDEGLAARQNITNKQALQYRTR